MKFLLQERLPSWQPEPFAQIRVQWRELRGVFLNDDMPASLLKLHMIMAESLGGKNKCIIFYSDPVWFESYFDFSRKVYHPRSTVSLSGGS